MKKLILFAFLSAILVANAQVKSPMDSRVVKQQLQSKGDLRARTEAERYCHLREENGVEVVGVIARVSEGFDAKVLTCEGIKVGSSIGDILTLRVPVSKLDLLDQCAGVLQYNIARKGAPMCDKMRIDTHVDSVQDGLNLPQAFTGAGVLVGVTDWGFDYTHPNYNRKNAPRILRAWDHYRLKGPAPQGFDYGTELVGVDALYEAQGDTSGLYGYGTHATHVTGIAAGQGTKKDGSGQYRGVAYEANILMASWLLDEASWLDAVAWMNNVAREEKKRLVINSSWGMYTFSTFDGTSLLCQAVNRYAKDSNVVFVTSAGNNGDCDFHLQHTFATSTDTVRTFPSFYSGGIGEALIFWGEPNTNFKAWIAYSIGDEVVYSPAFSSATDGYVEDSIVIDGNAIHYNVTMENSNPFNNRPHILINADRKSPYVLHMFFTADSGATVHAWNVNNQENHAGNIGSSFTKGNRPNYTKGDYLYGVSEPGCCEKTITVAAHRAGNLKPDSSFIPGPLATFSSRGPILDGRIKPEISAPGVNVVSSISAYTTDQYTPTAQVSANARQYIWAQMSGTSMSGPAVTGICALILQANPNISVDTLRAIIFRTAQNDQYTGQLKAHDSVSYEWGYGKINARAAVAAAWDKLAIEEQAVREVPFTVYPNPFTSQLTIQTYSFQPLQVSIYDIQGRLVHSEKVTFETQVDLSSLSKGLYIVRLMTPAGVKTEKIVKQ